MTDQPHDPNTLADELDKALPPDSWQVPAENNDTLVNAAVWMASAPRPNLPTQVKADLQAELIQRAQQQQIQRNTLHPNFQPLVRWALVASVLLAIMATGVPTTLASVPGDMLYPVKKTLEQVEAQLAASPSAQAIVNITHAERRLQEAQTLLNRGQLNSELIVASLNQMAAAAQIVRTEPNFTPKTVLELEKRTIQLNADLTKIFVEASRMEENIQLSAIPLMTAVAGTQDSGALLLPQTVTPMPTNPPTQTVTPVPTDSPTVTPHTRNQPCH